MSMMVELRELGFHVGWQYTQLNGIWQVPLPRGFLCSKKQAAKDGSLL